MPTSNLADRLNIFDKNLETLNKLADRLNTQLGLEPFEVGSVEVLHIGDGLYVIRQKGSFNWIKVSGLMRFPMLKMALVARFPKVGSVA